MFPNSRDFGRNKPETLNLEVATLGVLVWGAFKFRACDVWGSGMLLC